MNHVAPVARKVQSKPFHEVVLDIIPSLEPPCLSAVAQIILATHIPVGAEKIADAWSKRLKELQVLDFWEVAGTLRGKAQSELESLNLSSKQKAMLMAPLDDLDMSVALHRALKPYSNLFVAWQASRKWADSEWKRNIRINAYHAALDELEELFSKAGLI